MQQALRHHPLQDAQVVPTAEAEAAVEVVAEPATDRATTSQIPDVPVLSGAPLQR